MENLSRIYLTTAQKITLIDLIQEEIIFFESRPQLAFRNTIIKDLKKLEKLIKGE